MTPEERSELASLHALSLLEGEQASFAVWLEATDPEFAAEVAAFAESLGTLADAVAPIQPSDLLRERVLSLAGSSSTPAVKTKPSWGGWAAAALLAASAIWLWTARDSLKKENAGFKDQLSKLSKDTRLADLRIASLEGQLEQYKGTRAVVVWDPASSQGQIHLTDLPELDAAKDYQLWIVDPAHKNPVNGGLIHRAADGSANVPFQPDQLVKQVSAFAISVEKSGGVDVAEGPIVFLGK